MTTKKSTSNNANTKVMYQFNERIEQEAMNTNDLEVGKLYGIKLKNFEVFYRPSFRPSDMPDEVVYGRFVRKFGGSFKTPDEITEELMPIINRDEITIKENKFIGSEICDDNYMNELFASYLTNKFYNCYQNIAFYQFELEEGSPFYISGVALLTGFWADENDYTFHELLPAVGMFKNAADEADDDEDDA
jgi:hypothetical protein